MNFYPSLLVFYSSINIDSLVLKYCCHFPLSSAIFIFRYCCLTSIKHLTTRSVLFPHIFGYKKINVCAEEKKQFLACRLLNPQQVLPMVVNLGVLDKTPLFPSLLLYTTKQFSLQAWELIQRIVECSALLNFSSTWSIFLLRQSSLHLI